MRLHRRGANELGGQSAPQAVSLLPDAPVLPFEAQLEAVMLSQLLVIALSVGHTGVRQGAVGGERLRRRRRRHRLDTQHAVGVAETCNFIKNVCISMDFANSNYLL